MRQAWTDPCACRTSQSPHAVFHDVWASDWQHREQKGTIKAPIPRGWGGGGGCAEQQQCGLLYQCWRVALIVRCYDVVSFASTIRAISSERAFIGLLPMPIAWKNQRSLSPSLTRASARHQLFTAKTPSSFTSTIPNLSACPMRKIGEIRRYTSA
jgi:hypothetical protein